MRKELAVNVAMDAVVLTDEYQVYDRIGQKRFAVNHGRKEHARKEGELDVHVNSAESFFALLKRGLYGTFHDLSKEHLHRY